MRRFFLAGFLCLLAPVLAVTPAAAGYEEGQAALARDDWRGALDEWLPLAEAGEARVQYSVGHLYYRRLHNYADAVYWYRKAAEQGNAQAQTRLGVVLMHGKRGRHGRMVVEADRAAAIEWLRKAADQDFAAGQYYLGFAYARGWGVEQDDVEAVRWYRKAADQGFALAEYKVGEAYLTGKGAPTIPAVGVEWIAKAAENEASYAQFALGSLYESGRGVRRDRATAAKWYRRAADLKHAQAAYRLGLMYAAGQGVETDYVEAYRLLNRVVWHLPSDKMNMKARHALDAIGKKLTPAQRADIEQPALERLKRHLTTTPPHRHHH